MVGRVNYNVVTSGLLEKAKNAKEVEELLVKTCEKLNQAEVNTRLFNKMVRNGVATNDVRNFVSKQAGLKRINHQMNESLTRKAMKAKFIDACALTRKLRHEKVVIKELLRTKFKYSMKKCRKLVKRTIGMTANQRHIHNKKSKRKFEHCKNKMFRDKKNNDFNDIPDRVWEVVKDVNIFQDDTIKSE